MRKSKLLITSFLLALTLGMGIALMTPQDAEALWCPVFAPGSNWTDIPCYCERVDLWGVRVEVWRGYWEDGSICGYYTYCSVCPPKTTHYPIPYNPPGDGDNQ